MKEINYYRLIDKPYAVNLANEEYIIAKIESEHNLDFGYILTSLGNWKYYKHLEIYGVWDITEKLTEEEIKIMMIK